MVFPLTTRLCCRAIYALPMASIMSRSKTRDVTNSGKMSHLVSSLAPCIGYIYSTLQATRHRAEDYSRGFSFLFPTPPFAMKVWAWGRRLVDSELGPWLIWFSSLIAAVMVYHIHQIYISAAFCDSVSRISAVLSSGVSRHNICLASHCDCRTNRTFNLRFLSIRTHCLLRSS